MAHSSVEQHFSLMNKEYVLQGVLQQEIPCRENKNKVNVLMSVIYKKSYWTFTN